MHKVKTTAKVAKAVCPACGTRQGIIRGCQGDQVITNHRNCRGGGSKVS